MAKLQTKSDNINPFGGLFSIFKTFDKSGVRNVIDRTLGPRGTLLAFSHGIRIASSDTIERALRKLSEENTSHCSESGKTYKFNVASKMNSLMLKWGSFLSDRNLRLVVQRTKLSKNGCAQKTNRQDHQNAELVCPIQN